MKIKNQYFWSKAIEANQNSLGRDGIQFAQKWAEKMEKAISEEKDLGLVAKKLSFEAADEIEGGITGSMLYISKQILVESWEYGEKLKKIKI